MHAYASSPPAIFTLIGTFPIATKPMKQTLYACSRILGIENLSVCEH